ncbi:hypothetical protein [Dyadobacter diqingensis]|uniref:hypothetical protein n=1 Tax=Dyadobacter diqingensis TaxID=2938121 RepID=UPI0020C18D65|nr:hypothetical protein [Dyadobacter diqingensis]
MKYLKYYTAVRFLLGTFLTLTLVMSFQKTPQQMGMSPTAIRIITGLWDTGYLMQTVKVLEIITALSLLSNYYVRLTTILFIPVIINIILFDIFADNLKGLAAAAPILLLSISLLLINKHAYSSLLITK